MKRGLILSLCAMALGAFAQVASAQAPVPVPGSAVNVSVNLRYNDPANPAEGGKFYVVAKSANVGGFGGLAGLSINISNIDANSAVFGTAAENGYALSTRTTLGDNLAPAGNSPYKLTSGGFVNLVYGQDPNIAVKANIAKGAGTDGNTATDPLRHANWANATVIFSGTFGAARPVVGPGTDANVFSSATAIGQAASITTPVVRGDSLASLGLNTPATAGLRPGDANRDFNTTIADFVVLQSNFGTAPGTKTWDQGDFNNDGNVTIADFVGLQANFGQAGVAPQIAAVPEPASIVLFGLAALSAGAVARGRRS